VRNLVGSSSMIQTSDIEGLIRAEHDTLLNDYPWSNRKDDTILNTVAPYQTGTVSTVGSTVTGVGTVFTSSMVNRWIRIGSNPFFHKITGFTSATSLTVEADLPADIAAGANFTIFQHRYVLPANFGRAFSVTLDTQLTEWSQQEIDLVDPYRHSTGTFPDIYSIVGPNADNRFQIEFWPVPSAATAIRLIYFKTNTLTVDADIPLYRSDILVWKAGESACYFLYSKTGDQSWVGLADRYHARYVEALQGAREDDLGRASPVTHIKDRGRLPGRGDDFWLSHDSLYLR
jgi:hypothetical protein